MFIIHMFIYVHVFKKQALKRRGHEKDVKHVQVQNLD